MRFKVKNLRTSLRSSGGIRGIRLMDNDCVTSMDIISAYSCLEVARDLFGLPEYADAYVLTITEKGFGKLNPVKNYPTHNRGGKGVRSQRVSQKSGNIATSRIVSRQNSLMILSTKGNIVCIPIDQISIQNRNSGGVRLMTLATDDIVVSIATF